MSLETCAKEQTAQDVRDVNEVLKCIIREQNDRSLRVSKEVLERIESCVLILERAERNTVEWMP